MDKLILVFYIGVNGMSATDVDKLMTRIANKLESDDDTILHYFVPVRGGDSRVECINPKLVSETDYANAKEALDKLTEKLKTL